MKNKLSVFVFAMSSWFLALNTNAQSVDYQQISSSYPDEPGVLLKDFEHIVFSFDKNGTLIATSYTETEKMILKATAFNFFSTESVYDSYFKTITKLNAYTNVPTSKGYSKKNHTKIVSKPSKSQSIFYNDVTEKEIYLTSLELGATVNVQANYDLHDVSMLSRFYFQSYLPVAYAQLKITFPKQVDLGYYVAGGNLPEWLIIDSIETKKEKTITFTAQNLAGLKSYNNMPAGSYFMPHIIPVVKSYINPNTKENVPILGSTQDLYNKCWSFVKDINKTLTPEIIQKAKELTQNATTDEEKAKAIFNFVQTEVKYVAYEDSLGGFIPREAALVLKRKFGDCKDMSSLLRQLCRAVDLDARYVWIGTNSLPYSVYKTPFMGVFNHMIASVKIKNKWYFMDGTDPITPFGFIPEALQDQEAFIENDATTFEVVKLPIMNAHQSSWIDSTTLNINFDKKGLDGVNAKHLFGYNATSFIINMKYTNEKDKKELFETYTKVGSNKYIQTDFKYTIPNQNDFLDVAMHSKFQLPDYINTTQDAIYVNMNVRKLLQTEFIEVKNNRQVPFENEFKRTIEEYVELHIPKGYKVDYMPQAFETKNDYISAKVEHSVQGEKIILKKKITIDFILLSPANFQKYNDVIQQLGAIYKDAVVLKKK